MLRGRHEVGCGRTGQILSLQRLKIDFMSGMGQSLENEYSFKY